MENSMKEERRNGPSLTSLERSLLEEVRWLRKSQLIATGMMFATSLSLLLATLLRLFR